MSFENKQSLKNKRISALIVSDGFVYGWAFDPFRSSLTASFFLDDKFCGLSFTDNIVHNDFYASDLPPTRNCGFCFPLPPLAQDGFAHNLVVKINEWGALSFAPVASLVAWRFGPCFGQVELNENGFYEGWVGFRDLLNFNEIPPIVVLNNQHPQLSISLVAETTLKIEDALVLTKFRVPQKHFSAITSPVFTCCGTILHVKNSLRPIKVIGQLEDVNEYGIRGWLINANAPSDSLDYLLVIDGIAHAAYRPNIQRLDIANYLKLLPEELGLCGFNIALPSKLQDGQRHSISIQAKINGVILNNDSVIYQNHKPLLDLSRAENLLSDTVDPANIAADETVHSLPPILAEQQPLVSIVILNRNGADCLTELFSSFKRQNSVPIEIIVIDHDSHDSSIAIIKQWSSVFPIKLVTLDINDSFSASCNLGASMATAPHILFLNNDIVWLHDALPLMLDSLKDPVVAGVGIKLIKSEYCQQTGTLLEANQVQIQHLGVRFKLVGDQYWPYELTPDDEGLEAQFSPQSLSVVTGAVFLVRKSQFFDCGGFDESYFYGYEDVEFCLRLVTKYDYKIVCRNDLVALHRHGYTRLTGREPTMFDHQIANQRRLASTLGLWIKRQYWQSLLDGKRALSSESLTLGFIVGPSLSLIANKQQLATAVDLAKSVQKIYPASQAYFLSADDNWNYVHDYHVLVVLDYRFDLRILKSTRADLRTAIFINDVNAWHHWKDNPSLNSFDICLYKSDPIMEQSIAQLNIDQLAIATEPTAPLGPLLNSSLLKILIIDNSQDDQSLTHSLAKQLKQHGVLVYIDSSQAIQSQSHLVDVVINICTDATQVAGPIVDHARYDVIHILWVLRGLNHVRISDINKVDQVWTYKQKIPTHLKPAIASHQTVDPNNFNCKDLIGYLKQAVEDNIGRSFHTPQFSRAI